VTPYAPFPDAHAPEGHVVQWRTWDGTHHSSVSIRWENEGFTVSGSSTRENVEYVMRLSPAWQVRQFLLFRDLEDPDLWLATDGGGRWGEMNGAHRTELDGCYDVQLDITPFTATLPIRRLPLLDGHSAEFPVVQVNTDTLEVVAVTRRYTRVDAHHWRLEHADSNRIVELEVDQHGVVLDHPGEFRRA
jgi:hypothetical protein